MNDGKLMRQQAEERILGKILVKCKICDRNMRRDRQDGKVYYYCDDCRRCVWIEMPEYLDLE
jgi:formamidopyrimidine-DNA glycosylase